ncbi:MAG: hypothetical protein KAY37_14870, partial [Phycisphaerae bacterium]|nr:hypothetical protein [Phycisphaerae bacterium]
SRGSPGGSPSPSDGLFLTLLYYNDGMDIDLQKLPIPDWGLVCPSCGYQLQGLPGHRCPECGEIIDLPDLVRPWTRLRAPRFTGDESPLPDFGLTCGECGDPLLGAKDGLCPHCGAPFDLNGLKPPREWFLLDSELCGELPIPGVQALLASEGVPHVEVREKSAIEIYGGQSVFANRLRVASEFFFEVLWLLQRAQAEMETARALGESAQWRCSNCGEENPGHFDVCWNCEGVKSSE